MKRRVLVAVKGIKNENLDQIQKVSDAIETIKKFAREAKALVEREVISEETYESEEKDPNELLISMVVEIDGLEDVLGNIGILAEKLKTEIRKMDKAIAIGLGTAPAKE